MHSFKTTALAGAVVLALSGGAVQGEWTKAGDRRSDRPRPQRNQRVPGLAVLARIAQALSDDVWIVAPSEEQSGAGHGERRGGQHLKRHARLHH